MLGWLLMARRILPGDLMHMVVCMVDVVTQGGEPCVMRNCRKAVATHRTVLCAASPLCCQMTKLTGKTQVPCLVVGGDPMLESDAIIAYLTERFL